MSGNKSETTESRKTTLPHERLVRLQLHKKTINGGYFQIEAYNRRFEIQEEIDVMVGGG